MNDNLPYSQDVTADPYIVFGGLFSRKIISEELENLSKEKYPLFEQIVNSSNQCCNEVEGLQKSFEKVFNSVFKNNFCRTRKSNEPKCDRVLDNQFLVEIKISGSKFDPQFWQGGNNKENAVEQTRRYLDDENNTYNWAILTDGKILRLMHKKHNYNFIDFWVYHFTRTKTKQAHLLYKFLTEPDYMEHLLQETDKLRNIFNNNFTKSVLSFWGKYSQKDINWNIALVETVLIISAIRFLEDTGVINKNLIPNYQKISLSTKKTVIEIIKAINSFQKQEYIVKNAHALKLISYEQLNRIHNLLNNKAIYQEIDSLFWKNSIDFSELSMSFFGKAYQFFANKTDINGVEGQYFTNPELVKNAADYLIEDMGTLQEKEIIYDPFVGSGHLLRALLPYFHILIQNEQRESVIEGIRLLAKHFVGTDKDENAVWLARLNLTLATAIHGQPLLDFQDNFKGKIDIFEKCFFTTKSDWQNKIGINGTIRAIISNPPWKQLEQNILELFVSETGSITPKKKNKEIWEKYVQWKKKEVTNKKIKVIKEHLQKESKKHKETFNRVNCGKINLALSGLDFIDSIPGHKNKKWICFLPDCFFVGDNELRKKIKISAYYSFPDNKFFENTDKVMKFGIVFGGGSTEKSYLRCYPHAQETYIDVKNFFDRTGILPIYDNIEEANCQTIWFNKTSTVSGWSNGEFNEKTTPEHLKNVKGQNEIAIRTSKQANDKKLHECVFLNSQIIKYSGWKYSDKGSRVIVRESRSNTVKNKILWAGTHIPNKNGLPSECALSYKWNYFLGKEKWVNAICSILNTPLADISLKSIAGKRNLTKRNFNQLGLPNLSKEQIKEINSQKSYCEKTAYILLKIFCLNNRTLDILLKNCAWLKKEEKETIKLFFEIFKKRGNTSSIPNNSIIN